MTRPIARALALCVPLLLYTWTLKGLRIAAHPAPFGPLETLELLASDLCFGLGFLTCCVALLIAVGEGRLRTPCLIALQLVAAAAALAAGAAHRYWVATGSALDGAQVLYSLSRVRETWLVAGSEAPGSAWIPLAVVLAAIAAGPWIAARRRPPSGTRPRTSAALASLALGGALLSLAVLPRVARAGRDFSRDPVLHMIVTALRSSTAEQALSGPAESPLRRARLEATPETQRRNVVIVILESTGTRATTLGDPELPTTPFLAELAERSLVVERTYTMIPHSSKALVAILCGFEPRHGVQVVEALPGGVPAHCLAELLRSQGYATVHMQSAMGEFESRADLIRNLGFEDFIPGNEMPGQGFAWANYFGFEDDVMLEPSRRWLEQHRDRPFFVSYLTNTAHHHYLAPDTYGHLDLVPGKQHNRYLNSVRYQDFFLRNLFALYRELGLYENTLFVIVGDHGEGFGEHGRWKHDDVIYEEGLRVPLLIHDPRGDLVPPGRVEGAASQIDVVPTILDRLGFRVRDGEHPGRAIDEDGGSRVVHAACYNDERCLARIEGSRKLIHHFGDRPDELFDVERDPEERHDLAARNPELVADWRREALAWRERVQSVNRHYRASALAAFVRRSPPPIDSPLSVRFGDYVELIGVQGAERPVVPGQQVTLTYHFKVDRKLPLGYDLFVRGGAGTKVAMNHVPVDGLYPAADWKTGDFIEDQHRFMVPWGWRADTIDIDLGFWHPKLGRLPVSGSGGGERFHRITLRVDHGGDDT